MVRCQPPSVASANPTPAPAPAPARTPPSHAVSGPAPTVGRPPAPTLGRPPGPSPATVLSGSASAGKPQPQSAATAAAVAAVPLNLTLEGSLAVKVQQGSTLFVLARTPGQRGPPLAAKRLEAKFPQDVTLQASDAMLAGTGFVVGQQIEIVARVSNSGGAIARSGDLFGSAQVTVGKGGTVALRIDQVTP